MNLREEFERMMSEQCEIALATMTDGLPHVRIVNFYYTSEERRVYFATLKDNEKVVELAANPNIPRMSYVVFSSKDGSEVKILDLIAYDKTRSL